MHRASCFKNRWHFFVWIFVWIFIFVWFWFIIWFIVDFRIDTCFPGILLHGLFCPRFVRSCNLFHTQRSWWNTSGLPFRSTCLFPKSIPWTIHFLLCSLPLSVLVLEPLSTTRLGTLFTSLLCWIWLDNCVWFSNTSSNKRLAEIFDWIWGYMLGEELSKTIKDVLETCQV